MRILPITLSITAIAKEKKETKGRQKMTSSYRVRSEVGLDGDFVVAVIKGRKNRFRYTRQFEQFIRQNKLNKLSLKPIEKYIWKKIT